MVQIQWRMDSKIGPLYLVASKKGLRGAGWKKQDIPMAKSLKGTEAEVKTLSRALRQIEQYLDGKRKKFELPFDVDGTTFQKSVWDEINKISYSETSSYKDIATRIKNAKAVRAVGTAAGRNPLCIIVPCHRVITNNGLPGGYSGGVELKAKLLKLEQTGRLFAPVRR